MQQCPTCGSNVPDDADICPDCGMEIQSAAPPAPPLPVVQAVDLSPVPVDAFEALVTPPAPDFPNFDDPAAVDPLAGSADRTVVLDPAPAVTPVPSPAAPAYDAAPAASPAPLASLTLKRGGTLTSDKFILGKRSTIGRFDPDSGPVDVDLGPLPEASYVSRHHAEIFCNADGQWLVKDLGSRNGTFVRSDSDSQFQRVAGEQSLQSGCEVSLGNARFEFQIGS